MQLAFPGCQRPPSSQLMANRHQVQGRGPGHRAEGAEAIEPCPPQCRAQNSFLRSQDRVGSKIEKPVLKTRSVTCGLISNMKMMLCFNSSFPEITLSSVLGYPLNSGGDFEESLADPARALGSPPKTRE